MIVQVHSEEYFITQPAPNTPGNYFDVHYRTVSCTVKEYVQPPPEI